VQLQEQILILFYNHDKEYSLTLEKTLLGKTSKPHLLGIMLNGACMHALEVSFS
jgi:hypothetical protein